MSDNILKDAGERDSLIERVVESVLMREIEDSDSFDKNIYCRIEEKVRRQLAPFEHRFKPVLIHADPVPKNAVWTTDHRLILIDWDEAIAGAWISDFAQLTYWHNYSNPFGGTEDLTNNEMRDAFFRGYGTVEYSAGEIAVMENALHIIYSVDYLDFRDRNEVFSGLISHQVLPVNLGRGARPERV